MVWHLDEGYSWLASMTTTDLLMFAGFHKKVQSTNALRVKSKDATPITCWFFSNMSSYPTVKVWNFASLDLCRQTFAKYGSVQPSFNISISLFWWKTMVFFIASKIGTNTSLVISAQKKIEGTHLFLLQNIFWKTTAFNPSRWWFPKNQIDKGLICGHSTCQ